MFGLRRENDRKRGMGCCHHQRPRGSALGRLLPAAFEVASVRYRRTLPITARSGEGRLSEWRPAVPATRRERVKMPHTRPWPNSTVSRCGWRTLFPSCLTCAALGFQKRSLPNDARTSNVRLFSELTPRVDERTDILK